MLGYVNRHGNGARRGMALAGAVVVLSGSAALAQSGPAERESGARRPFISRWSFELAIGAGSSASVMEPFGSAGLYLDDSLAVVVEAGGGRHVNGEVPATGPAPQAFLDSPRSWPSKPASCPRVSAFSSTFMGGVQYRLPARHVTPFLQVLGGQASYAATASEPKPDGAAVSCYESFGSGRAMAAGGGIGVHLGDRFRLRLIADYRRLAVPGSRGWRRCSPSATPTAI